METFKKNVEEAFQNNDDETAAFIVDSLVVGLVKQGYARETLVSVLNIYYQKYEEESREKAADYIMSIMDALTGWTSKTHLI